jgi:glucuronoarabinoxylan endo-1,4-beta-xylanase
MTTTPWSGLGRGGAAAAAARGRRRVRSWAAGSLGLAMGAGSTAASAAGVVISPAVTHQAIDGFGASSAWTTQYLSDSDADLLFLATNPDGGSPGIGMSLLRIRAAPDGTSLEVQPALKAQARGAKVWATPWSPPSEWKDGTDDAGNGGSLDAGYYDAWAARLALFVQNMRDAGVDIVALSAQNEPTTAAVNRGNAAGYESCVYTAKGLTSFIGRLGLALNDAGLMPPLRIVAPETQDWQDLPGFANTILADPAASQYVGTLATHEYGGSPSMFDWGSLDAGSPRRFWETEIYEQNMPADPGMASALWMAEEMHSALTLASVNAWHFWWIHPQSRDNSGLYSLSDAGMQPAKRLYVMGNFSRFVRPGFYRVEAAPATQYFAVGASGGQVSVSAYCDGSPCDGTSPHQKIVIVAINDSPGTVQQEFDFSGVATGSWQSWVTSDSLDLMPGDVVSGAAAVKYSLQPYSVTTLVGEIAGPGPVVVPDAGVGSATAGGGSSTSPVAAGNDGCGLACSTVGRISDGEGTAAAMGASALAALTAFVRARGRWRRANGKRPLS